MDDYVLLEHREHRVRLVLGREALASAGFVRVCSAVLSRAGGDGKLPLPGPAAFLSSAHHSVPKPLVVCLAGYLACLWLLSERLRTLISSLPTLLQIGLSLSI